MVYSMWNKWLGSMLIFAVFVWLVVLNWNGTEFEFEKYIIRISIAL